MPSTALCIKSTFEMNSTKERLLQRMLSEFATDRTIDDLVLDNPNGHRPARSTFSRSGAIDRAAKCGAFCRNGIYPGPRMVKRVPIDGANAGSCITVCVECGMVWSEVDMVSLPDFSKF